MCAPRNLKDALSRDNWDDWFHAMLIELQGLEALGVFSTKEYSIKELIEMGITAKPMLASLIRFVVASGSCPSSYDFKISSTRG